MPPSAGPMAAFEEILAASEAGDAKRCMSSYAEDAIYLGAGAPPIAGKEAIYELIAGFFSDWDFSFSPWHLDEIMISGDLAIIRYSGIARMKQKDGSKEINQDRKCLDVFRQAPDGQWLLSRHMFNLNQ